MSRSGPTGERPHLSNKRAKDPKTGQILSHDISRHECFGFPPDLVHPHDEMPFGQGHLLFPPHMDAGQITKTRINLETEYHKLRKGQDSNVIEIKKANDAEYVRVKFESYGLREIGGFIRLGKAATVFPEEANGNNLLRTKTGEKVKNKK